MNKKNVSKIDNEILLNHLLLKLCRSIICDLRFDHDDAIYLERLIRLGNEARSAKNPDCDSVYSLVMTAISDKLLTTKEQFYELFMKIFPTQHRNRVLDTYFATLERVYVEENKNPIKILMHILANHSFIDFSYVLGSILFNNLVYNGEREIIVFLPHLKTKAIDIATKGSYEEFEKFIENIRFQNKEYYAEKRLYELEEIKILTKEIDHNLLDFLKIRKIYLYGSYARGTNTIYSDLDFLLVTDNKYFDNDLTRSLSGTEFRRVFGKYLDISVVDIHEKINRFDLSVLIEGIPIFDNTLTILGFEDKDRT